jgi:hypothetical protein
MNHPIHSAIAILSQKLMPQTTITVTKGKKSDLIAEMNK